LIASELRVAAGRDFLGVKIAANTNVAAQGICPGFAENLGGAARYGRHFHQQQVLLQRTCPATVVELYSVRLITYALPPRVPASPPALLGHCRRFAHAGHSRGGWPATSGGGRNARRFTRSSVSFWRVGSSGGCCKSVASQHRWRRNCVSIWNAASSASGLRGRDVRAAARDLWWRSRAREEASVRRAMADAWRRRPHHPRPLRAAEP